MSTALPPAGRHTPEALREAARFRAMYDELDLRESAASGERLPRIEHLPPNHPLKRFTGDWSDAIRSEMED